MMMLSDFRSLGYSVGYSVTIRRIRTSYVVLPIRVVCVVRESRVTTDRASRDDPSSAVRPAAAFVDE